jgi:hypothetical protein
MNTILIRVLSLTVAIIALFLSGHIPQLTTSVSPGVGLAHPEAPSLQKSAPRSQASVTRQISAPAAAVQTATMPLTITTDYVLAANEDSTISFTGTLTVETKANRPDIARIFATPQDEWIKDDVFRGVIPDQWTDIMGSGIAPLPQVVISDGVAIIALTETLPGLLLSTEFPIEIYNVEFSTTEQGILFRALWIDDLEWSHWTLSITTHGLQVMTIQPAPTKRTYKDSASWIFTSPTNPTEAQLLVQRDISEEDNPFALLRSQYATNYQWAVVSSIWLRFKALFSFLLSIVILVYLRIKLRQATEASQLPKEDFHTQLLSGILWLTWGLITIAFLLRAQDTFTGSSYTNLAITNSLLLITAGVLFNRTATTIGQKRRLLTFVMVLLSILVLYVPNIYAVAFQMMSGENMDNWPAFFLFYDYGIWDLWIKENGWWIATLIIPFFTITYFLLFGVSYTSSGIWRSPTAKSFAGATSVKKVNVWRLIGAAIIIFSFATALQGFWYALTASNRSLAVTGTHTVSILVERLGQVLLYYPRILFYSIVDLLPFVVLSGLIYLLTRAATQTAGVLFKESERWIIGVLTAIFAAFVVARGGYLLSIGIPISFIACLHILPRSLLLSRRLILGARRIMNLNPGIAGTEESVLVLHQAEFLTRTRRIEELSRQEGKLFDDYAEGKLDGSEYDEKRATIGAERNRLEVGDYLTQTEALRLQASPLPDSQAENESGPSLLAKIVSLLLPPVHDEKPRSKQEPVKIALPIWLKPNDIALSAGPQQTWYENGLFTFRTGVVLALLPVGFFLYVVLTRDVKGLVAPQSYFEVLNIVGYFLDEVAFWLVAAFVFGCLYAYLPGSNGVLKGTALAVVYALSSGVAMLLNTWLGADVGTTWLSRPLQLFLFLVSLGVLVDLRTLRSHGIYWRNLISLYNLGDFRIAITYLSPLLIAIFTIGQQLFSGAAQDAVVQIIKTIPSIIPSSTGR